MLKLKYLFSNLDLAEMTLKKWNFESDNFDMPLSHFRTSANAIYTFMYSKQRYFLRLAPINEKLQNNILGELEYIQYLRSNNYPAVNPIKSLEEGTLETVSTPWGKYYASVFEGVPGVPLDRTDFNDELMFKYGKMLGQLHLLSSKYIPEIKKWTHNEVIDWIKAILLEHENQHAVLKELAEVEEQLSVLPITKGSYGLVHYDFELDNVFYNKFDNSFAVIDFDDGMYNWYGLDVEQTLDSLGEELEGDHYTRAKEQFLAGYMEVNPISGIVMNSLPLFRRFINLYSYARLLRCIEEQWDNEPMWLVELRIKLANAMSKITKSYSL